MKWWKAIVIGFFIYWAIYLLGAAICVGGLGCRFPNVCNMFGAIMAFPSEWPFPTPVRLSFAIIFWTLVIAGILKLLRNKKR